MHKHMATSINRNTFISFLSLADLKEKPEKHFPTQKFHIAFVIFAQLFLETNLPEASIYLVGMYIDSKTLFMGINFKEKENNLETC